MAFSFRGLDIRHRLPDAKRSREKLRAHGGARLSIGVSTPQDGAYPSRIHDFGSGSKKQLSGTCD